MYTTTQWVLNGAMRIKYNIQVICLICYESNKIV